MGKFCANRGQKKVLLLAEVQPKFFKFCANRGQKKFFYLPRCSQNYTNFVPKTSRVHDCLEIVQYLIDDCGIGSRFL